MRRIICAGVLAMLLPAPAGAAGHWTLGAGKLRVELTGIHWSADERFVGVDAVQSADGTTAEPGDRIGLGEPDDPSMAMRLSQLWLKAQLGVFDSLDVSVALPVQRAVRDEATATLETSGTGDIILGAHWRLAEHLAYAVDLKLPLSEQPGNPAENRLPISEGQVDLTLWQRAGVGFGWHGWLALDLGYRVRFVTDPFGDTRATRFTIDPGDEFVWALGSGLRPAAAWGVHWVAVTLDAEGLHGQDEVRISELSGSSSGSNRRALIEVRPGLLFQPLDGLDLAVALGAPVYGRNYPAGLRVFGSVGYALQVW